MGIKPDQVSYTSDYFDQLYDIAVQMIKDGNAYAGTWIWTFTKVD